MAYLHRTGLYSKRVLHAALRLLEMQIECRETNHLIRALSKFPEIEIRLFLPQIMSKCMDDVEKWYVFTGHITCMHTHHCTRHESVTNIGIRRNQHQDIPREVVQLLSTIIFISKLVK